MNGLQYVIVEVQGMLIPAYVDPKEENSYITFALLDSLTYTKNKIKYGQALIPIYGEYRLTKGFFKKFYFLLKNIMLGYPMYIVPEGEEAYIVLGRDWLYESRAQLSKKKRTKERYLRISYQEHNQIRHLRTPLYETFIDIQSYSSHIDPEEIISRKTSFSASYEILVVNEEKLVDLNEEPITNFVGAYVDR